MASTPVLRAPSPAAESPLARADGGRRTIALVGPRTDSHGGVGATVRAIAGSTLNEPFEIVVFPTYRDGGPADKVWQAIKSLVALSLLLARRRVDLVHLHSSSGASFTRKALALALARLAGCPTVFHVHGGAFKAVLEGRSRRDWLRRHMLHWALEQADTVVALTPGWARELAASANIRRLRVVPNAPDLAALPRLGRRPNGDTRTILFLGHLYREKGIFELVDAFAELASERKDVRLVVAGEGSAAQALRRHVEAAGVDGLVTLPGWVGPAEKVRLLQHAACLVLPSYHEGLPLVVLEAMTAGVPVVASAVGGIPEVARHELEALLVEPRDVASLRQALERILDDEELAASLVRAARLRARDFGADALTRRVGSVYEETLAAR